MAVKKLIILLGVILAMAITVHAQNPVTSLLTNLVNSLGGTNEMLLSPAEIRVGAQYGQGGDIFQPTLGATLWKGRVGIGGELATDSASDVIQAAQITAEYRARLGRNGQLVGLGGLGYDWQTEQGFGVIGARVAYGIAQHTAAFAAHELHFDFRRHGDGPESLTKFGVMWSF